MSKIIEGLEQAIDFVAARDAADRSHRSIRVLSRLVEYFTTEWTGRDAWDDFRLNAYVIGKYPELFDDEFMLSGPTSLIMRMDPPRPPKLAVTSRSFALAYSISYEEIMDAHAMSMLPAIKNVFHSKLLLDAVADEIAGIIRGVRDAGHVYCPYVPVMIVRACDGESFQPKLMFKTRYGTFHRELLYGEAVDAGEGSQSSY